jgi:hypothetical protein
VIKKVSGIKEKHFSLIKHFCADAWYVGSESWELKRTNLEIERWMVKLRQRYRTWLGTTSLVNIHYRREKGQ